MRPIRAIAVAVSWLTVLPIPRRFTDAPPDRQVGGRVIAAVPVVGALLAVVAALAAWGLSATAAPSALIGVLVVAVLGLLTRGMHLDGLADTADGLGCYGPPERVAAVMRSGTVGPFGVATLVVVAALEIVGFGTLTTQSRWWELGLAIGTARVAAVVACRWSQRPAHPDGFGALVVGTQRTSIALWTVTAVAVAALIGGYGRTGYASGAPDGGSLLRAAITVVVMLAFTWGFTRHCGRRMGGLSGDVLGAVIELGTAIMLVGLML
ncbi:adenosylcobinamide-GDP ribazoletransferase [Gordonia sp. DT30]|uniref:adenosylcobinamide-GDP ribazoletransferase n=1 Tax=Gordonia sp. DT30 TaxID=3416546 RepID=UPI003CEA6140